jgi:hypothetical protein
MDTEEDAFWRRVSSDMFSSAISKHFSWNIETEGVDGVLEERNY